MSLSLVWQPGRWARRPGLPPTRPQLRVAFRPALVRSAIRTRSSFATARSTLQREPALRVEVSIGSRRLRKCASRCFQLFDDGQQVADRAGETIEPSHRQGFAGVDLAQQARQHGSAGSALEACSSRIVA